MTDYAELKSRLSIKADMIQLGEKIEWGSDSAIMREAAAAIDALERERDEAEARVKRFEEALQNIADSYEATSELHTSAADCAANLYDHARAALQEDKSHE